MACSSDDLRKYFEQQKFNHDSHCWDWQKDCKEVDRDWIVLRLIIEPCLGLQLDPSVLHTAVNIFDRHTPLGDKTLFPLVNGALAGVAKAYESLLCQELNMKPLALAMSLDQQIFRFSEAYDRIYYDIEQKTDTSILPADTYGGVMKLLDNYLRTFKPCLPRAITERGVRELCTEVSHMMLRYWPFMKHLAGARSYACFHFLLSQLFRREHHAMLGWARAIVGLSGSDLQAACDDMQVFINSNQVEFDAMTAFYLYGQGMLARGDRLEKQKALCDPTMDFSLQQRSAGQQLMEHIQLFTTDPFVAKSPQDLFAEML